jgi:hypothetical protein
MQIIQDKLLSSSLMEGSTSLVELRTTSPIDSKHIELSFTDSTLFGCLNEHVSTVLSRVVHNESTRLQVFVDRNKVKDVLNKAKKGSEANVLSSIHLYGPTSKSVDIGNMLSEAKIWLQRPDLPEALETYRNPHTIAFEGIEGLESSFTPTNVKGKSDVPQNVTTPDVIESIRKDVYSALAGSGRDIQQLEGDSKLKTRLLV